MHFPLDHRLHTKTEVEWWYLWGKLGDIWVHWALFKKGRKLVLHGSIRRKGKAKFFERVLKKVSDGISIKENTILLKSPKFTLECVMRNDPIEHKGYGRNYYSIPHLIIRGNLKTGLRTIKVKGNGWFDHAWGDMPTENWHWVSVKFYDGSETMITGSKDYCRNVLREENYFLDVIGKENIFQPKHGWPYSEQPFVLMRHGEAIGYGMVERTYRRF